MLQKQKVSGNDHYDLPLIYNVNGHTLHFGLCEFFLITGFKFGFNCFHKFREGDISFRDRVFLEKIGKYVKSIDLLSVIEDEERFTGLSDEDSIRVCLLLSLEVIFMGHKLGYVVDDVFLRMVDNLKAWIVFPWGEHIWQELYTAIRNVNSKHKDAHHKALEINPNFVPSYSLSGFVLCFKAKKPNYDLYPNRAEAQSEWFTKSNDFFKWYTPRAPPVEYGGLFGDYLKKLSSARTLREKDREAWSEIKSLKARVYKLETIINDKVESVGKQCDLGDTCWSDQDGDFFTYIGSPNRTSNKDAVNDLVDAFDDLVDANAKLEEVDKDLSQDDCVKAEKQEAEQRRLSSGWRHCKFPWCNNVVVDRPLWDSLIGLDDNRSGWLHEEHIDLWVWYMWHFRQSYQDWSMVSCNFLTLLHQESMPLFYATDEIYPLAWRDVEQVFILINEPNRHWSLALFHMKSRNVTFHDSQETFDVEIRPWYVKIRRCLESKLLVVLQETGVFVSKGIDPTHYSIKFRHAQNIPKQGGVFGDYGVFVCLFLYRLAHGILLDVEDPIQTALAYQEKMINFFFNHNIIFPS
ncbi:phospholipase-like, aminotransferase-like mobile domain protein [Tanacetum coccineum]